MKTPKRSLFVFVALLVVSLLAFNAHAARKKRQNAPRSPITIASAAPNCTLPGVTVATDPSGDQNAAGGTNQDIQSISVAELGSDTNKLTFTMKVADLSGALPPNAFWKIKWTFNAVNYFVDMETDVTSTVAFNYGTTSG